MTPRPVSSLLPGGFYPRLAERVGKAAGDAAGYSWVVSCALAGIIRGKAPAPVDATNGKGPVALDFSNHGGSLLPFLLGHEHTLYNLFGLGETALSLGVILGDHAATVGLSQFLTNYRGTLDGEKRLPTDRSFFPGSIRGYHRFVEKYTKVHRLKVRFEGVEAIPSREEPVVYAAFPHSSIFPDFFWPYVDSQALCAADVWNFRDDPIERILGFSLLTDLRGQPLVDRRDRERNDELFERMLDDNQQFGTRPIWFPNGTRVPYAFGDDGSQARAGFYSSIPNSNSLWTYVQAGPYLNAIRLAARLNKPVKLGIVTTRGAEFVMPNLTRRGPFIQPNRIRREVVYQLVEVVNVSVPEKGKEMKPLATLARDVPAIAGRDLGIDDYLRERTSQWGRSRGHTGTDEKFREWTAKEDTGLILADRIRSIPVGHPEREEILTKFLNAVHRDADWSKGDLAPLMGRIAAIIKPEWAGRKAA